MIINDDNDYTCNTFDDIVHCDLADKSNVNGHTMGSTTKISASPLEHGRFM